jgi:6-phosphogluconolactonase
MLDRRIPSQPLMATPTGVADDPRHPLTRRDFLGASAVMLGLTAAPGEIGAAPAQADVWELYVGTYTTNTASRGIYRLEVERASGAFRNLTLAAASRDPSFLALTPDGRTLVAVNELTSFEGESAGAVTAFTRDLATSALAPAGMRSSLGGAPCYVTVDRAGRHALVANYVGGNVAVFPLGGAAGVGVATAMVRHDGRGPNGARQQGPHAHAIILAPGEEFALAADLGIDRVRVYRFDARAGTLTPAAVPEASLAPGSGPRHLAFAPDGRTLFVVSELDSTLAVFSWDGRTGGLRLRHVVSTRPEGARGANVPADLHVHPTGRAVYVSNRGDDTLAVFDAGGGRRPVLVQSVPTGGHWPRNFALDPPGRLLLVAHQRSHAITSFTVDPATGRVTRTGHEATVPAPVCLVFSR